jgi:hypothetical protein
LEDGNSAAAAAAIIGSSSRYWSNVILLRTLAYPAVTWGLTLLHQNMQITRTTQLLKYTNDAYFTIIWHI